MEPSRIEKLKKQEARVVGDLLKKQNAMLGRALFDLDQLIVLQKSISLMRLEEINRILAQKLPTILSIQYFSLFLYDKNKRLLHLSSHNHPDLSPDLTIRQSESEIMNQALVSGKYILEQEFSSSRFYQGSKNPLYGSDFFVTIPLMIENENIGVLNLNDNEKGYFNVMDLDFILNVSEFISLSISNAQSFERAERLSVTDGLTGLTNRQHMQSLLKSEVLRSRRYKSPLSLVMLDVDHFKQVNDTFGHQEGDDVLLALASVLKRVCRSQDVAARYGGEEFVLVLPETKATGAWVIAERVREAVEKIVFRHSSTNYRVTVSCGIAGFDPHTVADHIDLIRVADLALYRAKETGRNRSVQWTPEEFKDE